MSTATIPTFNEWLSEQRERDDPVGDLAGDAARDRKFPEIDSRVKLMNYLFSRMACDDALRAAKRAWKEYERVTA